MSQIAYKAYELLLKNVGTIIHGKDESIKLVLTAWFAGGHILIEDNPGTGKTMLAKSVAKSVNLEFGRVQFTPDLLPSDITGSMIYDETSKEFQFNRGPIFPRSYLQMKLIEQHPGPNQRFWKRWGSFRLQSIKVLIN